ncbi:hypothetical protein VOLCADRAFT_109954 [Volvox carteri f. nagariensis]|uniref:Uncharacterized protein n=1 Tax=Volvox carteri f. nagariensis TaxID=3068 RepID=D8U951_VOLCA|nr:uncharacterized protein VOLCADRAFT_109954 [Volvox carteri f. nagariensis]EFJ43749.1 hypothetical protein VOLCADRAFT_109954 [Volvox carteri f. nagariensis]|eukprot:XP_002955230.1 hypothetical protein VOLCADRAFT_109954 [Volvox carteri f. nagariensis]
MPVFLLSIRAELENVESLSIPSSSHFCLDVKESAGSEEKKGVYVTSTEQHELSGSKGTANLVMKFAKGSKKEASINVQEIKGVTRPYTADDDGKFVPIIAFECRGLDPIAFHPEGDWRVVSAGGTKYDNVDLKEAEWSDYCEKAAASVGIYNFESKFELYRGS